MFWRSRAVYSVRLRTSARAFCVSACGLPLTWSCVRVIRPLRQTGAGPGSSCCWPLLARFQSFLRGEWAPLLDEALSQPLPQDPQLREPDAEARARRATH